MPDDRVRDAIFRAIDEVNKTRPPAGRIVKALNTRLRGSDGSLDSLALVNLIVAVEESVEDALGVVINLANQRAVSQETNPLATVQSLAEYVEQLVKEQSP